MDMAIMVCTIIVLIVLAGSWLLKQENKIVEKDIEIEVLMGNVRSAEMNDDFCRKRFHDEMEELQIKYANLRHMLKEAGIISDNDERINSNVKLYKEISVRNI